MIKQYLYRLIFLQIRFDVDIDLRSFPESGFERFFHLCGDIVRFDDRRIGVDFDVHVDDECVPVFTCAQVVECDDSGCLLNFLGNILFHFFGEGHFEKFLYAGAGELISDSKDKYSYDE